MTAEELRKAATAWLADDPDPAMREELQRSLDADDLESLREGFLNRLQFGTAGLRGLLGPGPGRMNRKLVRQVTRGVADALIARDPKIREQGIVVGGDARRLSKELADDTAQVFAGAGIKVHRWVTPAATPVIAWLQRELGAGAAVIVTASHNPPEYNGYKVYAEGAAQIIPPIDREISAAIDQVTDTPMSEQGIEDIDESIVERYYDEVLAHRRHPRITSDLKIVATPLHGVAGRYLTEIFDRAGYSELALVPEQAEPDGEFPTVNFPNPEEPGALDLAIEHATRMKAELILANDPDADRLAVALPTDDGWQPLTGNEIGCLLAYWLMNEGMRPTKPLLMTTIVSSRMLSRMAEQMNARYDETLTGFKWIAHKSHEHFATDGHELILGYEEALGYTVGRTVADKDGISAALIFAEMATVLRRRGATIGELLERLYRTYGLHRSLQHSIVKPGTSGADEIRGIMDRLRANPPQDIAGTSVARVLDWVEGLDGLPKSNVLGYALEGGGRILVRPSGTEPKIKFYLETVVDIEGDIAEARTRADAGLQQLLGALLDLCGASRE